MNNGNTNQGEKKMMMLTKANKKSLPALYSQDGKGKDAIAQVKFFTPDSNLTWYASEYDPESRLFFGLVSGFEKELGYFSLDEIETVRGPLGLHIERDRYFRPATLRECEEMNL
jgi:hypothetical protein